MQIDAIMNHASDSRQILQVCCANKKLLSFLVHGEKSKIPSVSHIHLLGNSSH